jgi:hypothetical protein
MIFETGIAALAFAVLNRVRGSRLDQLGLPVKGNGAFIAGLGVLGLTWWISQSYVPAIAAGVAYMVGELWGWTRWIHGLSGKFSQEEFEQMMKNDDTTLAGLADKIAPMRENYMHHCFVGMILRGLLWWVPLFSVWWWFGLVTTVEAIASVAGLSLVFPIVYWLAYKLDFVAKYLQRAEVIYGALYGAAFAVCLL